MRILSKLQREFRKESHPYLAGFHFICGKSKNSLSLSLWLWRLENMNSTGIWNKILTLQQKKKANNMWQRWLAARNADTSTTFQPNNNNSTHFLRNALLLSNMIASHKKKTWRRLSWRSSFLLSSFCVLVYHGALVKQPLPLLLLRTTFLFHVRASTCFIVRHHIDKEKYFIIILISNSNVSHACIYFSNAIE